MTATASSAELVVEVRERCALDVQVGMAVHVHGHLDGAVAHDLHDYPWVNAQRE